MKNLSLALDGPSYLHIALTNKCNLFCRHCWPRHSDQISKSINSSVVEMPRDLIDKIVAGAKELGTVKMVTFSALGEDAMSVNIEYAVHEFAQVVEKVTMFTNGTSLDNYKIRELVKCGLKGFNVSIEGVDKQSYEYIRRGATFEHFEENMRQMKECDLEVHIYTTVMSSNLEQLIELLAFAAKYGVPYINFSLLKGPDLLSWEGLGLPSYDNFSKAAEKITSELKKFTIYNNFKQLLDLHTRDVFHKGFMNYNAHTQKYCHAPFFMMVINQLGEWKPCCSDSTFFREYNLHDYTLIQSFNSPTMLNIRKQILSGDYPVMCKTITCGKGVVEVGEAQTDEPIWIDIATRSIEPPEI